VLMNLPPIHPALVHLPLAFVVLSFLADLFSRITGRDSLRIVGFWSLMAALVGGVATVAAGYFDMNRAALNAQTHEYVGLHLKIGWVLAVSLLLLSLWRWRIWDNPPPQIGTGYLLAAFLVFALTMFQGWFGGEMVYAQGAGVAAAGQGTESSQEAQPRLAKVKQLLSPDKDVGGTGSGVEKERGNGHQSHHK